MHGSEILILSLLRGLSKQIILKLFQLVMQACILIRNILGYHFIKKHVSLLKPRNGRHFFRMTAIRLSRIKKKPDGINKRRTIN